LPWTFGDCELDDERLELRRGGRSVAIQPKPLEFLFYLVRNRARAVTKRELLAALWPDTAVTENSLARVASLARLAIGDRDGTTARIRTIARRGYRFEGAIDEPAAAAEILSTPVGVSADPFVGREALMDALAAAWERTEAGEGQIALLRGEPGIGKTRAAVELAARVADAGASVAMGRCPAARGAPAFWPWVQVLRELVTEEQAAALRARLGPGAADLASLIPALAGLRDESRAGAGAEQERFLLCDGIASLFAHLSRQRPLLLWIDDLQWADAPSLVLLRHLPAALRAARVMLVATVRPDDRDATPALADALADLARADHCRWYQLEGLSPDEVGAFLEARGRKDVSDDVVTLLHGRTSGNPFFLREVVGWLEQISALDAAALGAAVEGAIPPGVRDVIGGRVGRVSEACRNALSIAALVGREFDVPLLEEATGLERPELLAVLDEAAAAHLVQPMRERPGRFAFEHELVREVIAGGAPAGDRARMHRRIGLAFETLHAHEPEPPLAALAHHFHLASSAGEEKRALEYAIRGAAAANSVLAFEDAATHFERAIRALELLGGGAEQRLALLLELTEARLRSGSVPATRDAALRAADAARALGDAPALVRAALGYGGLALWGVPASPERRALLEEALAAVGPAPSPDRARVLARLIAERPDADVLPRVLPLAVEAVAIARRIGDPECLAETLHAHHFVLQGPDHLGERAEIAREVLSLGGKPELAWAIRENVAADALIQGDVDQCRRELARARAEARALRSPAFLWLAEGTHASLALLEGRLDEAERLASDALAFGQRTANPNAAALFVGQAHLLARERGTIASLVATIAGRVSGVQWIGTYARVGFARMFFDLGRVEEARAAFCAMAAEGFAALPRRDDWLASLCELAALCADLGERSSAPALAELLEPFAGWHAVYQGPLLYHGPVTFALARLAATQGRASEARALLERARAEAAAVQSAPWVARVDRELI
jgi:DNA-binding winged helix-turn-helix (wHTH) protein